MNWLRTRLSGMSARQRAILASVATVLLAVVVILVVSALSPAPEYDSDTQAALGNTEASMILLDKALLAEESGDTTSAIDLLQRAMAIDGGNAGAASALERIRNQVVDTEIEPEDPVEPDPSPDEDPGDDIDPAFLEPTDDISYLLPEEAPGWRMGPIFGDSIAANSVGEPTVDTRDTAARLVMTVIDKNTAAEAQGFIVETSKSAYQIGGAVVEVDGVEGYFGTNGVSLATVSYVRGRYVFEVLMTSATGNPIELKVLAVSAAEEFPDTMP